MKNAFCLVLTICLILIGPCALPSAYSSPTESQLSDDQMFSIAETQFDIAKLLIKEGRYDRVLPEMRKIFDLNFQGEDEQLVAKSSSLIARLLVENRQTALAHALLDETLQRVRQRENVVSVLKIKAYIFKSEGKFQKAIETLERAVEIERQGS